MPRYFVDFQSGDSFHRDDEGSDLDNLAQARTEAVGSLPHVAPITRMADDEHHEVTTTVRDEQGAELYRATLTFHGETLGGQALSAANPDT